MKENGIVSSSLGIKYPIIMAPMFLVSNQAMVQKAMTNGIMGTFPTLNFREKGQLDSVLETLNRDKSCGTSGNYGVNLIVQKSNPLFDKQYKTCVDHRVPFYITSLGNPARIMDGARSYGAKVYADIVTMEHAEKCAKIGVDGFIAVGAGAGGHGIPHQLSLFRDLSETQPARGGRRGAARPHAAGNRCAFHSTPEPARAAQLMVNSEAT